MRKIAKFSYTQIFWHIDWSHSISCCLHYHLDFYCELIIQISQYLPDVSSNSQYNILLINLHMISAIGSTKSSISFNKINFHIMFMNILCWNFLWDVLEFPWKNNPFTILNNSYPPLFGHMWILYTALWKAWQASDQLSFAKFQFWS